MVPPFSAVQWGKRRTETSDFHWGFFPPTPSSLLLCLASACHTLLLQLSFVLISTCPVTTPHASLLTNSMSWCSHTCPAPIWCWVKRLLNFGSDDPGKEQNMFRTQLQLLCAFTFLRSQLSEPEGLIWALGTAEWLLAFLWSWPYWFNGPVLGELSSLCSVIFTPNLGIQCITMVLSEQTQISCVSATALSLMIWFTSMIARQSLQLIKPLLDLQMV